MDQALMSSLPILLPRQELNYSAFLSEKCGSIKFESSIKAYASSPKAKGLGLGKGHRHWHMFSRDTFS